MDLYGHSPRRQDSVEDLKWHCRRDAAYYHILRLDDHIVIEITNFDEK